MKLIDFFQRKQKYYVYWRKYNSEVLKTWLIVVISPGQKILTRGGSGQPFMVWVFNISPKTVKYFHFFSSDQKKSLRVR